MQMSRLRPSATAALGVVILVLTTACAGRSPQAPRTPPRDASPARWSGALLPRGTPPVSGNAVLTPSSDSTRLIAIVSLRGSPSAVAVHPWRVVAGPCGQSGPIVGAAVDYPPIQMRVDGTGHASATLRAQAPAGAAYSVQVFRSAADPQTVIACGDLRLGAM